MPLGLAWELYIRGTEGLRERKAPHPEAKTKLRGEGYRGELEQKARLLRRELHPRDACGLYADMFSLRAG